MISTKWFQGVNNIAHVLEVRKKVFFDELNQEKFLMHDIYDEFAFNVVIYEDEIPVGCGRLLFKEGKYFIDNVCVLKEHRGRHYGDLIVRMLVRRAVNMGAENTYSLVDSTCKHLFVKIGFIVTGEYEDGNSLMMKAGDVGGGCI